MCYVWLQANHLFIEFMEKNKKKKKEVLPICLKILRCSMVGCGENLGGSWQRQHEDVLGEIPLVSTAWLGVQPKSLVGDSADPRTRADGDRRE